MPTRTLSRFITVEGPEGSGKSTQVALLAERLRAHGLNVAVTREPGGTPIGTQIRQILLDPENSELAPVTELLLMFASRAQNLAEFIQPALANGAIVLCDRFTDSTLAYQGARGVPADRILTLDQITGSLTPDLTILLDIDISRGLARARSRNTQSSPPESRIDDEPDSFHHKVRAAFLDLARRHPERIKLVDASASQQAVAEAIWAIVAPVVTTS